MFINATNDSLCQACGEYWTKILEYKYLKKITSTSTSKSTGFLKVLEYKYFEKYLSTSTEYVGCKL